MDVRLSSMRALIGNVPRSLRAMSAEVAGDIVRIRSIFDETASDPEVELLRAAATEIIADFPEHFLFEEEIWQLPVDAEMNHLEHLIFLRHETTRRGEETGN